MNIKEKRDAYLEHCRRFAGNPKELDALEYPTVAVRWHGMTVYPSAYQIAFNADGSVKHTAILLDPNANAIYQVRLEEVEL